MALTHQAAAAVSVGTYWAWENTTTCGVLGGTMCFSAHRGRRGAGAYRGGRPPTACYVHTDGQPYVPTVDPILTNLVVRLTCSGVCDIPLGKCIRFGSN